MLCTSCSDQIPGISSNQLNHADQLLLCFYQHIPDFYGEESCKINFHYLLHLSSFVRMWGPLWVYLCFGFENMNGHLKKMFRGTSQILGQLVFSVKAQQSLAIKHKILKSENRTVMDFLGQYIRQQIQPQNQIFVERRKRALPISMYTAVKEYTGLNLPNTSVDRLDSVCVLTIDCIEAKCIYSSGVSSVSLIQLNITEFLFVMLDIIMVFNHPCILITFPRPVYM